MALLFFQSLVRTCCFILSKIAEVEHEIGIKWSYCPSSENLADLGSGGAN